MLLKKYIIYFAFATSVLGIDSSHKTLKNIDGFEFCSFSSQNGYPYFKLEYKNASTERPKVGFLKFGLAFLKIKDLKITLDLRHADNTSLQAKWDKLLENRAIKYVAIDKIYLKLIDNFGYSHIFVASQAKFMSSGEFRLWGNVSCICKNGIQEFDRILITYDKLKQKLVFKKNENDSKPLVLQIGQ